MKFSIFDFTRANGQNDFSKWWRGLQKKDRTKLRHKIDMLMLYGDSLHPLMLSDTEVPGVQKIRVQGNPKLRPLLCKGPCSVHTEYTMLLGAKEIGGNWAPLGAPTTADANKKTVLADPKRRVQHEKIPG
jgi:hypothetical protein